MEQKIFGFMKENGIAVFAAADCIKYLYNLMTQWCGSGKAGL